MAQGLQLSQRMSLSQVLAPQLQQSLALLQAPTLELKALVEQELQQNPMLEEVSAMEVDQNEKVERGEEDAPTSADPTEPPADVNFDPATEKASSEPVDDFQAESDILRHDARRASCGKLEAIAFLLPGFDCAGPGSSSDPVAIDDET